MSAIQRDREIAAKATQGEWSSPRAPAETVGGSYWHGYIWSPLYYRRVANPVLDVDSEHIVRLHNRQPLYDALVDAVREHLANDPNPFDRDDLRSALAALDREEKGK